MRTLRFTLLAAALALCAPGCGETAKQPPPQTAAAAHPLDGFYGADLPAENLRGALEQTKPPVELHAGWWTMTIDVAAGRLNLSNPQGDNVELRITAVGNGQIELAPDIACEQRGAARTQPARLNWTRSGTHLRFHAVDVPCLTDKVLLTLSGWQRS
jgi:hypothetical protein